MPDTPAAPPPPAANPGRPLSPHLSIYRFQHTMALSILHRICGVWLSFGLLALVYWLASVAAGEGAYERARVLLGGWFFRLLLLSWLAAWCYHFANGLRHLCWDAGFGLERAQARRTARVVIVVAALALLLAAWLLFRPYAGAA
jgi:succinate dehydrogenase / fumarate reductase cytochrome b subunit